jgi:hypothetical protein
MTPDRRDVAARAYSIYEARGKEDGHDEEDWHKAEAELAIEAGGPADAGPNVPVDGGKEGPQAGKVMPDVDDKAPATEPPPQPDGTTE